MTSDRGTSGGAEMQLDIPVTPKSPGLNPNASVFLSCKSATGVPDTGQWEHSDSGINSSSDYSYANGDISSDKSDTGVFSPTSDSPFQPEFTPQPDNPVLGSDSNANVTTKFEENQSRQQVVDSQGNFSQDVPVSTLGADGNVPVSGITYTDNGTSDGEAPVAESSAADDQLRQVLKQQLETYFSRENLSSDSYLQSQMDADQYVPIATVASLDQIQKFNCDLQLIVELLRESTVVQVDEKGEKVRPNHNRCIVILREIPDSTPVEDVQNLFSGENCPKFVSCEFAHNNNWYVTFDSDADAQRAYRYLREEVRTFQGKPIMARIKANALIRTSYNPRNGYINKYVGTQPQQPQQPLQEVATSTTTPPQTTVPFTAPQPFTTLMPGMSQYISGQQQIPFYPPPNPLLQTWPAASPTVLDPSMVSTVLAMNGYQATNVKMNVPPNRNIPFPNNSMNRNNIRNQKMHNSNRPMNHERNDPPPRMMNHDRPPNSSNGSSYNKTSPRNSDPSQISNHQHMYPGRRLDGIGGHNHMIHGGPQQTPAQQHLDSTNNNVSMNSRIGMSDHIPISQRFAGKSYKSRRRRDEEGANRPARLSSSSQPPNSANGSTREGSQGRFSSLDEQFDYEPTSFPPLPGSASNASSGEVFESKLSDVVRGTAKAQVKEVSKMTSAPTASAPATSTTTPSGSTHTSTSTTANRDKTSPSIATSSQSASPPPPPPSQPSRETPLVARTNSSTSSQPPVSPTVRSTSKPSPPTTTTESKSNLPPKGKTVVENTQSRLDDKSSSSAKLSYAQMVQKRKEETTDKTESAEKSDSEAETPLQQSNKPNQSLKEQGQPNSSQKNVTAVNKTPAKDMMRKDRENDEREEFRKYREGEPKEQRFNNGRRLKENRERPGPGEKFDRPGRRDFRERDGQRSSVGK